MSARGLYTADPREKVDRDAAVRRVVEMQARASTLTPAQKRVLVRLAAGDTIREAATNCGMSRTAVRNAVEKVLDKLHAKTTTQAVANAIRLCVID